MLNVEARETQLRTCLGRGREVECTIEGQMVGGLRAVHLLEILLPEGSD